MWVDYIGFFINLAVTEVHSNMWDLGLHGVVDMGFDESTRRQNPEEKRQMKTCLIEVNVKQAKM
jgi:hypothetical protein